MAKIKLTKANIDSLYAAFEFYYPNGTVYAKDASFSYGDLKWDGLSDFLEDITETSEIDVDARDLTSIKAAQQAIQNKFNEETRLQEEAEKAAKKQAEDQIEKEKEVQANIADEAKRQLMEEERQRRETAIKKATENARRDVQNAIKKQQEIHNSLKGKNIYRKVTEPKAEDLSPDKAAAVKVLQDNAKENPQALVEELSQEIEKRINTSTPDGVEQEEVAVLSRQAALRVVENLRGKSLVAEALTANKILSETEILDNLNLDAAQIVEDSATNVGTTRLIEYQINRKIISSAFGEDIASNLIGPKDVDKVQIVISTTPQADFEAYDISNVTGDQLEFLKRQDFVYDSIQNTGADEIKSVFLKQVNTWIESKIPETGPLANAYNTKIVQAGLSYFGLGEPIAWEGTTFFGRIAVEFGYGPTFGWAGEFSGVNFGVSRAAASITAEVGAEAATGAAVTATSQAVALETTAIGTATAAGGAVATGGAAAGGAAAAAGGAAAATGTAVVGGATAAAGGAAGGAAAGAAAGSVVPVVGTAIGAVVGTIIGLVAPKAIGWIKDHAREIDGVSVGLSGAVFGAMIGGGITGAIFGFGVAMSGLSLLNGGVSGLTSALSSGASTLFGAASAVWATFMSAIGTPIISFLIGFPILVTLILVIVNSSAYVVPPNLDDVLNNTNPYIQVEKTASPEGPFENSDLPLNITYTVKITAKTSTLTAVRFKNECQIVTSGAGGTCPAETPPPPASISPGAPFIFTYEVTYSGTKYQNSIVNDTFTVTANSLEENAIEVSGGASVTIGEPPTGCLSINQAEWPSGAYSNIVSARSTLLAKYSDYVSKVCLSYKDLPLKYNPSGSGNYWGWNHGTYIDFFALGVKNQADALYTLTHELGHSLAWGSKTAYIYAAYLAYPGIRSEAPYCFYSNTSTWNDGESMPEAIAFYVIEPRCGSVQQKYPIHYQFLKKYIFN